MDQLDSNISHLTHRRSTLLELGGGFGLAAIVIAMAIMLAACAGFGAALFLSPLPPLLGVIGLVFTCVAGWRDAQAEGSQVVAGMFINVIAIVGGIIELTTFFELYLFRPMPK